MAVARADGSPPACEDWQGEWQETKIFFGLSKSSREAISRRAVDAFVQEEIVRAFPDGFTLVETTGYWRGDDSSETFYENGLMLVLLHPKTTESTGKIDALATAFRARFEQQSVLIATQPSSVRSCNRD
ncbi:MAG: DUF3574 domain-containing protein [Pseudomonadota bacterium]